MQPINYMLDVAQPLQMALAGYQQGRGMRAQEEGMQQQRRLMEMQEMEFQQQQQALRAQQQRAAEVQDMMGQFAEDLEAGNVDMGYLNRLVIAVPEMAEMAQQMYQQTTEPQQRGMLDRNFRLLNLIRNAPDQVVPMLEQQAEAYENAGDPEQAKLVRLSIEEYKTKPAALEGGLLTDIVLNPLYDEETMGDLINPKDELTEAARTKMQTAMMAGYEPGTPEFKRFIEEGEKKAPLTTTIVEGERRETAFEAETGKQTAQNINTLITEGRNARRNLQRLDLLERRLDQIGDMGGLEAWAKVTLGQLGFETEGVEEAEALDALINQLIPTQRPPGSGEMSNKDVDLFRKSVPRLMSTVAGRYEVLRDMRAVNEYLDAEAEIAERVLIPKNDPRYLSLIDANSQIRALRNPLAKYREEGAADQTGLEAFWPNAQAEGVTRDQWDKMSPEQKSLFED